MECFALQVFHLIRSINISFMLPRFCVLCLSSPRVLETLTLYFHTILCFKKVKLIIHLKYIFINDVVEISYVFKLFQHH